MIRVLVCSDKNKSPGSINTTGAFVKMLLSILTEVQADRFLILLL